MRPEVSQATEIIYRKLWPYTIPDEENGWELLKYVDAIASVVLEPVRALVADYNPPIGITTLGNQAIGSATLGGGSALGPALVGWGIIFDVDTCPPGALPYLAQFLGVVLEPLMSIEEQRTAIRERPNLRRGTVGAVLSAAQKHLTGTKAVGFFERVGSAYNLTIRTLESETPSPTQTKKDILTQKPAGIKLDYEALEGLSYLKTQEVYPTYEERTASGKTYEEIRYL